MGYGDEVRHDGSLIPRVHRRREKCDPGKRLGMTGMYIELFWVTTLQVYFSMKLPRPGIGPPSAWWGPRVGPPTPVPVSRMGPATSPVSRPEDII